MQINQAIQAQKIFTIQLHICPQNLFNFYNTFFIQSFKCLNRGITITIVSHDHVLHEKSEFPFAVINASEIIHRQNLLNLLESIAMQQPVKFGYFKPIFKMCEEISSIGRIFSEKSSNPYYLLLSPLKKWNVFNFNNEFKKHFYENTHYIDQDHEKEVINQGYFQYQVNNLATYVRDYLKVYGILLEGAQIREEGAEHNAQLESLCIFSIYALLRSLKQNSPKLYDILKNNEVLGVFQKVGLNKIVKGYDKQVHRDLFLYIFRGPQEQKEEKIHQNPRLLFYEKLCLPVIGLGLFWKIYTFFSQ